MDDREEYEKKLRKRQAKHLKRVRENPGGRKWRPCLHNGCTECHGTGIRKDGTQCVHMLSCPCPKCNPLCVVNRGGEVVQGNNRMQAIRIADGEKSTNVYVME